MQLNFNCSTLRKLGISYSYLDLVKLFHYIVGFSVFEDWKQKELLRCAKFFVRNIPNASAIMANKVKGLLKGIRYISQIFDEKEQEMQIGHPTDVKHVAHIGWDGPSATTPTWINGFTSSLELASRPFNSIETLEGSGISREITKTRHQSLTSGESPFSSPARRSSDGSSKHNRRHRSSDAASESSGSIRHARRNRNSNLGVESPQQNAPTIPKHSHRKKSKGSTGSGSGRPRSKDQNSLTDNPLDLGSGLENAHVQRNNEIIT
ncbi:CRIB domain containing protein [Quillaja saponaria]|uniref:CRIB domain containing protein n=1 Tax=Quillaja saponaria TaxID=32244 RepID=A0AAD7QE83_QUISA|nr:CRIB domain containing protein [Quillaja saponaria]